MIILYGNLRKEFGREIKAKVHSVRELIRAAEALRPGFTSKISRDRGYIIRRGDELKSGKDVSEEELEMNFSENTWHILPVPMGYSGALKTIAGVALIVVGAVVNYVTGGTLGTPIMKFGAVLALTGVASLFAPSPNVGNYEDRESPSERPSYLFNGPTNRTSAGGAVPLVYGFNVVVGSTFLSGGLEVGDVV